MNFYIGDTISEIDEQDDNIEFSDELIDFIYKLDKQTSVDMSKLYEINPYDDIEIPQENLSIIIEICNYILNSSLLEKYEERDEGKEMLYNLARIAQKALKKNEGLISIGD